MRWRRLALWLSLGTLTLIVLMLTWLWTADLGVFKPQVERFVSEQTGRTLSIDGNFYVDLARHATIIAEDVRFQNAEWADQDDMVTVGRLEVRVDLWSLIGSPFVIELVDIDDTSVLLVNPEDGDPNWVLPMGDEPKPDESVGTFDFLVEQIYIDGFEVTLDSARRNRPLNLQLHAYRQQHRDDDMLQLDFDALLDGRVVRINAELGTWDSLLAGKDIQFDIDSVLDTFEMTASGRIDDLIDPKQPEIDFMASGPDIDDLTQLLGLGEEGDGDINLSGSLQKDANERLVLEANGNFGQTKIQARGTVTDLQDLRNIDVDILASGPDFGRIARLFGIDQVREAPFTVRVDAETQGETFIINEANIRFGEAQIDARARMPKFPSIDDAVISLLIEGPDIARFRYVTGLPGAAEGAFSLGFTIDVNKDGVEVLRLDLETSLGELRGNGRLGEPPDFLSSRFDLQIRSDSLERLASAYGIQDMPDYPIEFSGDAEYVEGGIRSIGPVTATVGQVSATLDGFVALQRRIIDSDLAFTLKGPNLADMIGAFTDGTGVPQQAYDLRGRMQSREDGFRFREVTGSVGSSSVDIDGVLTTRRGLDGTRFDFELAGPSLEELVDRVGDLEVRQGPYELSGSIVLAPDMIQFSDFELDRDLGDLKVDLDLGLPLSRKWMDFAVSGRGRDVRSVLRGLERFEAFEQPFSLGIRGGLRGDYWNFEQLDIGIGESILQAVGDLDLTDARRTTEFSLDLSVPNLTSLGTIDGRAFNEQAFSLVAHVDGRDGALTVDQLNAVFGQSDVRGFIQLKKGNVPSLDVDVYSDSLIFVPLLEEVEFEYDPAPKFDDGRLIPDVVMPFDAMREIDVSVDIDIKELQRGPLYLNDIEFDAILRDGVLDIQNAQFKPRSGALLARARLEPAGESGTASIELIARNFALGVAQTNLDLAMTGDIDMNLQSTGADLRTLAGNLDGMILLSARGGRVTNSPWVNRLYGDLLSEILNTINPFRSSDPYTDFECVVVPLLFDNGSMSAAPNIFVSTNKIRIAANPSINLKTEDMRVGVRTTPRRALSVSMGELVNPYVQVVGTLAAPRLAVDEKGVLITGGAAVATGGLTLIARGLWDRISRSGNPCAELTDQALGQLEGRLPDLIIEGAERLR